MNEKEDKMNMVAKVCLRTIRLALMIVLVGAFICPRLAVAQRTTDAGDKGELSGQKPVRPNIILFLVDDMGWQDTTVPFGSEPTVWNQIYRTPNMERLASQGMKFTQAYAASPVCSPTRVSLMTGKNPARTKVTDWVGHGISKNRFVRSPHWRSKGLQPGDGNLTLPEILKGAGYRTIHIGKAHFGAIHTPGANPCRLGFDINVGGSHNGGPRGGWYSPWRGKERALYPGLEDRPEGEYLTDAITAKALELISDAARDQVPFFMNMAQFAVHTKIAPAPDRFLKHFQDGRPEVERDYASMLEAMDDSLGKIIERLHDPNGDGDRSDSIAQNTMILFMSDNGGLSSHTRSDVGVVELEGGIRCTFRRGRHNAPLKGGKGTAYEGGVRVPLIVAWAGQQAGQPPVNTGLPIQPGTVSNVPVHADDFFPTILAMASVENPVPADQRDGIDFSPLLRGKSVNRSSAMFWHYPHQWYRDIGDGLGVEPFTAMRDGDYKLIYFYGDGSVDGSKMDPHWELYRLTDDLGEAHNLITEERAVAQAMRKKLMAWMKKVDAQTPVSRSTRQPIPLVPIP